MKKQIKQLTAKQYRAWLDSKRPAVAEKQSDVRMNTRGYRKDNGEKTPIEDFSKESTNTPQEIEKYGGKGRYNRNMNNLLNRSINKALEEHPRSPVWGSLSNLQRTAYKKKFMEIAKGKAGLKNPEFEKFVHQEWLKDVSHRLDKYVTRNNITFQHTNDVRELLFRKDPSYRNAAITLTHAITNKETHNPETGKIYPHVAKAVKTVHELETSVLKDPDYKDVRRQARTLVDAEKIKELSKSQQEKISSTLKHFQENFIK